MGKTLRVVTIVRLVGLRNKGPQVLPTISKLDSIRWWGDDSTVGTSVCLYNPRTWLSIVSRQYFLLKTQNEVVYDYSSCKERERERERVEVMARKTL